MTSKQNPVAIVVTLLRQLDVQEALTTSSASFRRRPESRRLIVRGNCKSFWTPACAGVTKGAPGCGEEVVSYQGRGQVEVNIIMKFGKANGETTLRISSCQ